MTPRRRRSALTIALLRGLRSRTVWVAIAQAIVGGITAAIAVNPSLEKLGWVVVGKSVFDIWLRAITTKPIGQGQP